MKYLNNRDEFLNAIKTVKYEDFKLNESVDMTNSGPFSNDVPWGDTLVGRLVNAIRRKIGIGVNIVRIQPLIRRLKTEFDNIIEYSLVGELSEEDKKKMVMIIICTIIRDIKLAIIDSASTGDDSDELADIANFEISDDKMTPIKDEDYLKEVDSIITEVIILIQDISVEIGVEIDNQDELIKILQELQKQVKEMKKKFKEEEEGAQKDEEDKENKDNSKSKSYNENFKSVAQLMIQYKSAKDKQAELYKGKNILAGKEVAGKEVGPGSELGKSNKEVTAEVDNKNLSRVTDSFLFEANQQSPVLLQLKKTYDTFIQIEPDTIKSLESYLKMSEENQLASKFSGALDRIYTQIRKKQGISERILIKEDINVLLSNDTKIADSINNLYNVSKQKPDGSFDGISPEMKSALVSFNTTMKNILSSEKTKDTSDEDKEEVNKNISDVMDSFSSRKLMRYNSFRKINEADDNTSKGDDNKAQKLEDVEFVTISNQKSILSAYWTEIYESKISKILVTEQKYKELKKEVVKINVEVKTALTLDGMDPIISVLKLFNRAYKLYTVNSIPGGRTGGKISRGVSNEYTPVGGGSFGSGENLSGTNGPYRNNRIFNMWENAVLDITRDRKYQPIFSKKTKIRVGDELKEAAGPIFLKLINDLLDGSKLYGQGQTGKGAQHEFIEKYFGTESAGEIKPEAISPGGAEETKQTQEIAEKVKSTQLSFEDKEFEIKNVGDLKRTIIKLEVDMIPKDGLSDEEKEKLKENKEFTTEKRYFLILEGNNDLLYVIHSSTFFNILKYIRNDFEKKGGEVTFKDSSLLAELDRDVYLMRMKPQNFNKMIRKGTIVNLVGLKSDSTSSIDLGKQKTISRKWLCQDEEKNKYLLENYSYKNAKGFATDRLASNTRESTIV